MRRTAYGAVGALIAGAGAALAVLLKHVFAAYVIGILACLAIAWWSAFVNNREARAPHLPWSEPSAALIRARRVGGPLVGVTLCNCGTGRFRHAFAAAGCEYREHHCVACHERQLCTARPCGFERGAAQA